MLHNDTAAVFAAVFAALYAAHHIGDQWVQTHHQACTKGGPGWTGRLACLRHVVTITVTKLITVTTTSAVIGLSLSPITVALALALDAASHYWADRRSPLARLAELLGKGDYYRLGAPRLGRDDNPSTGTGAFHLDQSWHIAWLWITALIIAAC
ncbi:DUF3307 domain-containing protein [Actinomadura welshii]|uniref:DUF3307 domain-containing protein n=1 Tax=Actinomadura welshii TaxID=3103817 RepID=UPI0003ACEE3B|nr:DUF3307 domain-containing protein [Actinomadura madurae]